MCLSGAGVLDQVGLVATAGVDAVFDDDFAGVGVRCCTSDGMCLVVVAVQEWLLQGFVRGSIFSRFGGIVLSSFGFVGERPGRLSV